MKTITINVPDWVPTNKDFTEFKSTLKYWLFPPRCIKCNVKMKTTYLYLSKEKTGYHPLDMQPKQFTSKFSIMSGKFCNVCAKKYIHSLPLNAGECALCGDSKFPVIGYHFTTSNVITFLWFWWNSGKFCLPCVDDLLETGYPDSNYYKMVRLKDGTFKSTPIFR